MTDNKGAFDLSSLSAEDQERIDQMAEGVEPEEPEAISVLTAFSVVIEWDGRVRVVSYDGTKFSPAEEPNNDNLTSAAAVMSKDVIVQETALNTVQVQMMQAAQMKQQMEAQRIAQATQGGIDLSNIRRNY